MISAPQSMSISATSSGMKKPSCLNLLPYSISFSVCSLILLSALQSEYKIASQQILLYLRFANEKEFELEYSNLFFN